MECKKLENLTWCNCSFNACGKKGICCECVKYHRERNEIPACFFSEEMECGYDRSIENFIKDYRNRKTVA
ncbi:hypothetical protein HN784_04900 [bacterium]|jgi:hypothetical protein|nr:hypothetical protein [bacterium]MBT4251513.1 hypothetical protein [bacterium]MBT4597487.1 hypothetical protein [bacterium]MBT6754326.1 hypothetical protein [bacterium]MBT7037652.1 hypothetical protein [bacterium]